MTKQPSTTIANRCLSLTVDSRARIVSLVDRRTKTEYITHPEAAEGWRLVVPTGLHTLALPVGSRQAPGRLSVKREGAVQSVVVAYEALEIDGRSEPIQAVFTLTLPEDGAEIAARVRIVNGGSRRIDEVEFPVVGGMGGFPDRRRKRALNLLVFHAWRLLSTSEGDVLNRPLPDTGRESDPFVREHETAMWEDDFRGRLALDFYANGHGLMAAYLTATPQDFAFTLERYPKGVPHGMAHAYPPGTPHWLRLWGVHLPQLAPGAEWVSEPVTLFVHEGEWHDAASLLAQRAFPKVETPRRHRGWKTLEAAAPPPWMEDFVGWTLIIGKLYTGEVFHDFARCADRVLADKEVTGLDLLFYYGHTNQGAEGADYDQSPAADLGGEAGFARMLERLHAGGVRVMLLDHFHRYIDKDLPEYAALGLERFAVRDADGRFHESRWWKETVLSCRRLQGPTPVWREICPACEEYWESYLQRVLQLVERGVDGLELDCFSVVPCHNPSHNHEPGYVPWPEKLAAVRRVYEEVKRRNPNFVFFCETMDPESRAVCDGWLNNRAVTEDNRTHRFMFPHLRQQTVRVSNYGYDAVNKSLMLGLGVDTQIWGLRTTTLDSCPELARYIGQVTRLRRRYGDILIRGTYRDTLGARVRSAGGAVLHSVLDAGPCGKALVLRNPAPGRVRATAKLEDVEGRRLLLVRPGKGERSISSQPVDLALGAYEAAVILAL